MDSFAEKINSLMNQIDGCATKMSINRIIIDLLLKVTTYHFDSTGEYEYKGSSYSQFDKIGIAFILTLVQLIVLGKDIKSGYTSLYKNCSNLFDKLDTPFCNIPESEVISKLNKRTDQFFDGLVKKNVMAFCL